MYLFLAIDRGDGHLIVIISDMDAYGPNDFIAALENVLVSALSENFPNRRIEIERHRGISPLGP
jgi:hypothetical protein